MDVRSASAQRHPQGEHRAEGGEVRRSLNRAAAIHTFRIAAAPPGLSDHLWIVHRFTNHRSDRAVSQPQRMGSKRMLKLWTLPQNGEKLQEVGGVCQDRIARALAVGCVV